MNDGLWGRVGKMTRTMHLTFVAALVLVMVAGLGALTRAEAGTISVIDPWPAAPQIPNTTATSATTTFTPSAGSDRLILIQVFAHTNNTTATTITADYGNGSTWTPATLVVNSANNQRRQAWLFYLSEADIAASSGNTIRVTTNNAGSGWDAYIAAVDGVDQASPVNGTYGYYENNTTNIYTYSLAVADGGYSMAGMCASVTGDPTNNESYTGAAPVALGATIYATVKEKLFPVGGTTNPTFTYSGTFRGGISAATFNPNPCSATAPSDLAPPLVAYNQVDLTWTYDGVNNTSYNVYRDGLLQASNITTGSYSDTTVAQSTAYTYTVRGWNGTCESGDSNSLPVTTPTYVVGTIPGSFSFANVTPKSMDVTVSYTGDDNDNNSVVIKYGTDGVTYPNTAPAATRGTKNWTTTVSGLSDSTIYYFEATFTDNPDGVSGTNPALGSQKTKSVGLMHKSGVVGDKYGNWGTGITCATCHQPGSTNIKRIRPTVSAAGETYDGRTLNTSTAGAGGYADTATTNKVCDVCHTSTQVYQFNTTTNNGAANPPHPSDTDCVRCHKHRKGFKVNSGCVDCHAVGGTYQAATGALTIVDKSGATLRGETYGGHLKATTADGLAGLTDDQWNAQCLKCHDGHVKDADSGVNIPNNTSVGINYVRGYIALGGTATSGSTEAEICWNCHDVNGISEWGTNTDTNGAASNYDFGTVYTDASKTTITSRWIGTYWVSANFTYKAGWLNNKPSYPTPETGTANGGSTHAASSGAGTAKGIDAVDAIHCSYCHDVHNTAALTAGFAGAANDVDGKPYLRGRWMGSPYNEDGAPRSGQPWTYPAFNVSTNPWGAVPRGGPTAGTTMGGYWIDQNSGNPVSTWTATQFGGLCDLCHGSTKDGSFASAEIDALNQYDAVGAGWVSGLNGHVNVVQGASHNDTTAARNIFAGRGGATNQTSTTASHPFMLFDGTSMPGDSSGGFRGGSSQYGYQPAMGSRPMDGDGWVGTQWNNLSGRTLDLRGTTVNANFHSFSCSKCHTPHASRLPALMITNCLDTKNNTWDNDYQVHGTSDAVNAGRSISNWSSAQNCHRLGGDDPSDTRDTPANTATAGNKGWNTVTPW